MTEKKKDSDKKHKNKSVKTLREIAGKFRVNKIFGGPMKIENDDEIKMGHVLNILPGAVYMENAKLGKSLYDPNLIYKMAIFGSKKIKIKLSDLNLLVLEKTE